MIASFVAAWSTDGAAADATPMCLSSYESGQRLKLRGKLIESRQQFQKCALPSCPSAVSTDCARFLSEIDADLPSVVVGATDAHGNDITDVKVRIDDVLVAERLDGRAIDLDPGLHMFRFEAPDAVPVEQPTVVRQGEKNRMLTVRLEMLSRPPGPVAAARRMGPAPAYVLGGVMIAGLTAGGILFASAAQQRDDLSRTCAPDCSSGAVGEVRTKVVLADISFALGGLAAAGAVTFLLVRSRKPLQGSSEFRVVPSSSGVFGSFAWRF